MDLFNRFIKKNNEEKKEKTKTEQINEKRSDLKLEITAKLYAIGFSDEEVEKVLIIIKSAEDDIQRIKDSLIGTNINPVGDPGAPLKDGIEKIRQIQVQMQKEVNETIAKIAATKKK